MNIRCYIAEDQLFFNESKIMKACYKKLWKLLIDKNLKRTDLKKLAGISSGSLAKLGKDENVSMDVLQKICKSLNCNIGDIVDLVPEEDQVKK